LVSSSVLLSRKLATNSKNKKEVQTRKSKGIFEPRTFLRRARQMKHTRQKTNGMKRHMFLLPVFLVAVVALILGAAAPNSWARGWSHGYDWGHGDDDEIEIRFDEAEIFFELNDTDGDLGIHALIDGEPWKSIKIEFPNERTFLWISAWSKARRHGLTELSFESAEYPFEGDPGEVTLSPEQFFRRFPAGEYEIEGRTLEGEELESEVVVSHVMPAPPGNVQINGESAAEDCDADPLPSVSPPVTISWDPVTASHPEIGEDGVIAVAQYQLVVEREEPTLLIYSVNLPPGVTEFPIPEEFTDLGDEFKFEILVRAENGNRTAVETCFEVE
jgi:hypothetical protein